MRSRKGLMGWGGAFALAALMAAASPGCAQSAATAERPDTGFPPVRRDVAPATSSAVWATDGERDAAGEAEKVFDLLRVSPGVRVADLGVGDGYYTLRAARRIGGAGTVYAEDVDPGRLAQVDARASRAGLPGVRTVLGRHDDPQLPPSSVDVAILAHAYHQIREPYAFLYHLAAAIAPGGRLGVIALDRPIRSNGTPLALLQCELEAVGYQRVEFYLLTPSEGYLAIFEPPDPLPAPRAIRPCQARE